MFEIVMIILIVCILFVGWLLATIDRFRDEKESKGNEE